MVVLLEAIPKLQPIRVFVAFDIFARVIRVVVRITGIIH